MVLADFDLFDLWRQILVIACWIYAIVTTAQWVYSWYGTLWARDRYTSMARQYLLVQLLRISPRKFVWELVDIAILTAVMIVLIFLHVS